MKRTYIAAAALLLGTSAFAWAPSSAPVAHDAKDPVAVGNVDQGKDAASGWWTEDSQMQPAAFESWSDQPASGAGDPDMDLAEDPAAPVTSTDGLAEPDPEATDSGMTDAAAATGVGGPDESAVAATADTVAAADFAPRPAAQNYPPCDPGPGDDNCIQLYEPGVRMALASWNQPTGGLLDHQATTAMGGPYEPVATTAGKGDGEAQLTSVFKPDGVDTAAAGGSAKPAEAELVSVFKPESGTGAMGGPYEPVAAEGDVAMNGDGVIDPASGETAELEVADAGQYTGVGGPVVETGYPPCQPGPGDDRCIQLYEPGVTGAGN